MPRPASIAWQRGWARAPPRVASIEFEVSSLGPLSAPSHRWRVPIAWLVLVAVQLLLLRWFGGAELFRDTPVAGLDHDTHLTDTRRVLEGFEIFGKSWVWDVRLLAGFPNGTIFDADNKGLEVFVWLLHSAGLEWGFAFNMFLLVGHLGLMPAVYLSARWLDLGRPAATIAAGFALLLWSFDSWLHWCWYVGMISYAIASWLWLLPLALFIRWWRRRGAARAIGVALLMALCHLVHPYSFFLLVTPLLVVYLSGIRGLDRRGHLAVWGIAAFTVIANLWWLRVALQWWPFITDSSLFGRRSLLAIAMDLLGIIEDPAVTGIIATRTSFRVLAIALGAAGCWVWWRRADPRGRPLGITMIVLLLFAYFGGATPLAQVQPYRHVGPLALMATIPAAALAETAWREGWSRSWPRSAKRVIALLAFTTTLWCMRDVLYFTAGVLPSPKVLPHGDRVAFSAIGHPLPIPHYAYGGWHRDDLATWVRAHDDGQGRFLVEGWNWGEQLAWKTDAQILGGFIWRNLEHSWANLFRRRPQGIVQREELAKYFTTYGVRWVIISTHRELAPWWDRIDLIELVAELDPFRIYRVRQATHLLDPPQGQVEVATNRLRVQGTDPTKPVLLRYHWLPTLVCEPDCSIERRKVAGDPVGFFRVPAPHPADFQIRNAY
jgi:hypothetical protein